MPRGSKKSRAVRARHRTHNSTVQDSKLTTNENKTSSGENDIENEPSCISCHKLQNAACPAPKKKPTKTKKSTHLEEHVVHVRAKPASDPYSDVAGTTLQNAGRSGKEYWKDKGRMLTERDEHVEQTSVDSEAKQPTSREASSLGRQLSGTENVNAGPGANGATVDGKQDPAREARMTRNIQTSVV